MHIRKLSALLLAVLALALATFAQPESAAADPDKEKRKKELDEKVVQMLDQAVADAGYLRLPQNKAIVFAMAADLYWKFDEKKARDLFKAAAGELSAYNVEAEREKRESTEMFPEYYDFNDPRGQVLPLVGKHDPEMALELLLQTRPASLTEAILKAAAPDAKPDTGTFNPENQRVRQEIALEQQFALQAADQNPDRAVKMIRDSLSKGVSHNVLQLLQKLHKKDEKKASELGAEVVRKLVDTDLGKKQDELQVALSYLQFMARTPAAAESQSQQKSKPFQFSDAQTRDLANKLAATFMQPGNSLTLSMSLTRALPTLEKLLPERAATLRQRQTESQRALPTEMRNSLNVQRMWDPSSTPEQILAEIPRLASEIDRNNAYNSVVGKISQIDDEARAKRLIDQIGDERARNRALEQFESNRIGRASSSGKLDDARRMIATLTNKRLQIQKLVQLAAVTYRKGGEENVEAAKGLMKSARSLVSEVPEDEDDLNSLMEIVRGYATVEPEMAFVIFEPVVEQINEVVQASAVLSKYNKRNRTFKKGELLLRTANNMGDALMLFRYLSHMQMLGKADLERMSSLTDRFTRGDARTLVKLVVVQGFLRDDKRPEPPVMMPGIAYFEN